MNRLSIHLAIACLATALSSGCDRSQIIDHSSSEVIEAAQSIAPNSTPPRYTTTEVMTDQKWSVVITENVPGEKFESYEITVLITKVSDGQSEIAIDALRTSTLVPNQKKKADHIARKYAEQLKEQLKQE